MKSKIIILSLSLIWIITSTSNAQMNQIFNDSLQNILEKQAIENEYIGISAAAIFPDGSIWQGASGQSNQNVKMDTSMVFMIASVTKNMLATLIMHLDEENILSIEDSLGLHLPKFKHIDQKITIKQLLNHTSGLSDLEKTEAYEIAVFDDLTYKWSATELLTKFQEAPLGSPGSPYSYSNSNYILLAAIVESVTGNTYEKEFRNRVITPYKMNNTWSGGFETPSAQMAGAWYDIDEDGNFDDVSFLPKISLLSADIGAGNAISKPSDMVRYAQSVYEGKYLSKESLNKMLQPAAGSDFPPFISGYGLGTSMLNFNGHPFFGHDGLVIHQSIMVYNPLEHFGVVVCVNHRADVFTPFLELASFIAENLPTVHSFDITKNEGIIDIKTYPNPFSSSIHFEFNSTSYNESVLNIFNQFGVKVKTIRTHIDKQSKITWDGQGDHGENLPAGLYFYRLTSGEKYSGGSVIKL